MKKRKNIYCRLVSFSNSKTRYLNFKEWQEFCKTCYLRTGSDSSNRKILYEEIKNDQIFKAKSIFWAVCNIFLSIVCGSYLFEIIICVLHSKEKFDSYRCEYYFLTVILTGLVSLIIYLLNNPKLFTIVDGEFAPGAKIDNGYWLYPIAYVTFFENLEKSDAVAIRDDFYKFRKQFYDYLN